jgi:RNA polymerase sigma-70 factor (ECF subfamily)
MVMRRCRYLLKDEEKAFDAMQEVFLKLLQHKNRMKNEFLSSLLYRIATNICLNVIRSEKKKTNINTNNLLSEIASNENVESNFLIRETLNNIFKGEKESSRTIAVMHYLDGMTLSEVAKEIKMSVSGVRKRLRKLKLKIDIMGV